ncbi:MAG TPA: hypothetical protein VGD78_00295 [Chthoniobacterales bacterium]
MVRLERSRILRFSDCLIRSHEAEVERFVVPAQVIDRAAGFIVPEKLPGNDA